MGYKWTCQALLLIKTPYCHDKNVCKSDLQLRHFTIQTHFLCTRGVLMKQSRLYQEPKQGTLPELVGKRTPVYLSSKRKPYQWIKQDSTKVCCTPTVEAAWKHWLALRAEISVSCNAASLGACVLTGFEWIIRTGSQGTQTQIVNAAITVS